MHSRLAILSRMATAHRLLMILLKALFILLRVSWLKSKRLVAPEFLEANSA
jgi:hypothetical protein